jgi:hypothetical protein
MSGSAQLFLKRRKRLPLTLGLNCLKRQLAYTLSPQTGGERVRRRFTSPLPVALHVANGEFRGSSRHEVWGTQNRH